MEYTLKNFEEDLRVALNHFYDPIYAHLVEKIAPTLACASQADEVQEAIKLAIEGVKPLDSVPANARSWRVYLLLYDRYILRLTQKETAERLSVTIRHLRREQNIAIHILAESIFACSHREERDHQLDRYNAISEIDSGLLDWSTQVRSELTALKHGTLDSASRLAEIANKVIGLIEALATRHGVEIIHPEIPDELMVAVPSTALQQIFVQCLMEMIRQVSGGQINIEAREIGEQIQLLIKGSPVQSTQSVEYHLIAELVNSLDGTFSEYKKGDNLSFEIGLPTDRIIVLVVDDNLQLTNLYQRYVQGTRYKVFVTNQGGRIFEIIEAVTPDIILLDAMLPDVDGWELLAHLHAHPDTQSIPIIVCTVVREEELAIELGARVYLPKPVLRQQFLQALDEVAANII